MNGYPHNGAKPPSRQDSLLIDNQLNVTCSSLDGVWLLQGEIINQSWCINEQTTCCIRPSSKLLRLIDITFAALDAANAKQLDSISTWGKHVVRSGLLADREPWCLMHAVVSMDHGR